MCDDSPQCGVETLSLSPVGGSKAVQLTAVKDFKPALTAGGHIHPVALTSGNRAMNNIIKNWATAIRRVRPPLPFVVAALDKDGYAELEKTGYVNLYKDDTAHSVFQSAGSNYGDPKYADMSAYKWHLAADLLDTGACVRCWLAGMQDRAFDVQGKAQMICCASERALCAAGLR